MEIHLANVFDILYIIIGSIGVAIIVWEVLLSVFRLLKLEFNRVKQESIYRERESVRHKFATYLLLALEFLITADIIAKVIHPKLD